MEPSHRHYFNYPSQTYVQDIEKENQRLREIIRELEAALSAEVALPYDRLKEIYLTPPPVQSFAAEIPSNYYTATSNTIHTKDGIHRDVHLVNIQIYLTRKEIYDIEMARRYPMRYSR